MTLDANIGKEHAIFNLCMAAQCTDILEQKIANPTAIILASVQLLVRRIRCFNYKFLLQKFIKQNDIYFFSRRYRPTFLLNHNVTIRLCN